MFSFLKKSGKGTAVYTPITGRVKALKEVPDEVFSSGMMGPGFAVEPAGDTVVSPVDGEVAMVFPTGHALGLKSGELELIVHIGVDTVKLKGEGFTPLVREGQAVKAGTPLVRVDFDTVRRRHYGTDTLCVVTSKADCALEEGLVGKNVSGGQEVVMRCTPQGE